MKKKLFLPMITSVIITILIYLFSLLFISNFDKIINYIFISLIYVYLYINCYLIFNNLNKVNKKIFIIFHLGIVLLMISIWQIVLKIKITNILFIIPLVLSIVLICVGIVNNYNILDRKKGKKKTIK